MRILPSTGRLARNWLLACAASSAVGLFVCGMSIPASFAQTAGAAHEEGSENESVVLNFEGADIREVIYSLATALDINYWLDPRVQGQVTVRTASPIAREDLLPVFHHILRNNGYIAVDDGEMYVISPAEDAKARVRVPGREDAKRRGEDHLIMELVKLEHAGAEEIVQLIQTFVTPGGDILAYPRSNLVIISDIASNAERLADLIRTFDTDTFDDLTAKIYRIEHASLEEIGEELSAVLDSYQVLQSGAGLYMIPLVRLNSIAVISADKEVFVNVEYWLSTLDVPAESSSLRKIHVYHVENTKAADLSVILNDVFANEGASVSGASSGRSGAAAESGLGLGGGFGGRGGAQNNQRGNTNQRGAQQNQNQRQTQRGGRDTGRTGAARGGAGTGVVGEAGSLFEQEVSIVADEITNALVILATPRDFEQISDVLKQLDIVPRQVLIEVLLAEITLTNDSTFGAEHRLLETGTGSNTDAVLDGGGTFFDLFGEEIRLTGSTGGGVVGVFTHFRDGRAVYDAVLSALASRSRVKLLSRPHILTADNKEASILIGNEVPIITQQQNSTAQTGGSSNLLQNVQYRDTGIIIRVLPQVNSAGLVNMQISQEVSEIAAGLQVEGITSPTFTTRETETTVVVQNGETIVIGGIIQENKNSTSSGVPFLMDIPVLGQLFKRDSESLRRTELVVLITPYVVRDREEARSVTEEFKRRVDNVLKEIGPDIETDSVSHTFILQ